MSDLTLLDLRRLLDLALTTDGPTPCAIARLGATVGIADVARAYLPHWLPLTWAPGIGIDTTDRGPYYLPAMLVAMHQNGAQALDLTDPATCAAVLVALALSYGLDPGPMGLGVMLVRDVASRWLILGQFQPEPMPDRVIFDAVDEDDDSLIGVRVVAARHIAAIPTDRIADALIAMVRHRLETP